MYWNAQAYRDAGVILYGSAMILRKTRGCRLKPIDCRNGEGSMCVTGFRNG